MVVKLWEGVVGEPFVGEEGEVLDAIEGEGALTWAEVDELASCRKRFEKTREGALLRTLHVWG